ncbi:hypothetical protein AMTR_s00085p00107510 [Amborella trichopoda]|uniref:Uncharacterized protein n=1 Tax=Amborella trichopoda TaxID=13333 RepID=W1P4Z2_AMBTC|nr:hypothetical protein AMTR_s00085p00107510 [Amborella trichopoda]
MPLGGGSKSQPNSSLRVSIFVYLHSRFAIGLQNVDADPTWLGRHSWSSTPSTDSTYDTYYHPDMSTLAVQTYVLICYRAPERRPTLVPISPEAQVGSAHRVQAAL